VTHYTRMLGATANGIPATAVNAGLEYAQRLTTDAALQAEVNATFNPSLATRDLKRAAEVLAKPDALTRIRGNTRRLKPLSNKLSRSLLRRSSRL